MRNNSAKAALSLAAVCGGALGLAALASAQPTVVHVSGATLLENYLNKPAASLDFIDADGNRQARSFPSGAPERLIQQLAPFEIPGGSGAFAMWSPATYWGVLYSAVGSGNGLQELIDNGRSFNSGNSNTALMKKSNRSSAFFNRYKYLAGGSGFDDNTDPSFPPSISFIFNDGNAAGVPVRAVTSGPTMFKALYTTPPTASTMPNDGLTLDGGVTVDVTVMDVPVRYFVTQSGAADPSRLPGQAGYGNNASVQTEKDGTMPTGRIGNKLASATPTGGGTPVNINTDSPDENTIFDTSLFFAPIAPTANFGIAGGTIPLSGSDAFSIRMTDLHYLFGAGRTSTGENLMVINRDSGSGTRNGFQNSIGQDPSWGVGENIGARNNSIVNDRVGPDFYPSQKGGNPRVEETIYNARLGVGYVGPERGMSNGSPDIQWLREGYAEIVGVVNNLPSYGGTTVTRPSLASILHNSTAESWFIGGPAAIGTIGDPRSAPPEKGGYGWMETYSDTNGNMAYDMGEPFSDFNQNGVRDAVETRPGTVPPAMRNVEAAAFVNNITRSIDLFEAGFTTPFTPGELAATQFILTNALNRVQNPSNPSSPMTNPTFNQSLQDFVENVSGNIQGDPAYAAFGTRVAPSVPSNSRAGKVPTRKAGAYSDSSINAQAAIDGSYLTEGGTMLAARANLPLRNLTQGDFNGDGLRNLNDAADLVGAFLKRTAGGTWTAPNASGALAAMATTTGQPATGADLSIELLGDFNADGNFDAFDLRYWADGLALTTGANPVLDRKAGFTALDNALNSATGGADNNLFNTVLATGKPYAAGDARGDVANASGRITRGFQPIGADGYITPAADANRIDSADITYIYKQFKQNAFVTDGAANWDNYTEALNFDLSADMTSDRIVDQADVDELVKSILGTCYGDVNLDGAVNNLDLTIIQASIATPPATVAWATGDLNGDGVVNSADLALYCPADINCSGAVTVQDIFDFLALYFTNAPKADVNGSGDVSVQDIFDFLAVYFGGC